MSKIDRKEIMQNVSTYLPVRLVEQIEGNKGDVSRNLFIKRAISKALENQNKNLINELQAAGGQGSNEASKEEGEEV
jgi:hypothetical protein